MANNGYIDIDLIGVRMNDNLASIANTSVICHTNRVACCGMAHSMNGAALGNWFFPNGSTVLGFNANGGEDAAPFFARNRGHMVVNLYRVNSETDYPSQRGHFCCVVPDLSLINQTHCVSICMFLQLSL